METLQLTTSEITPQVVTSDYRVIYLALDWENKLIVIRLRGTNGEHKSVMYEEAIATTLMTALNKADLSVKSLHKRILERIIADGFLAGTITGVPD